MFDAQSSLLIRCKLCQVQRPKMLSSITLDIYVLRSVLGLVRSLASINQDIRLVADEVGQGLLGELDYQGEAQRSQEFKSAHMHLGFVQVPDVIASLTTKRFAYERNQNTR